MDLYYVINYEVNFKLGPCPNYCFRLQDGKKIYFSIEGKKLTDNEIKNIYMIKDVSSIDINKKHPWFNPMILGMIFSDITDNNSYTIDYSMRQIGGMTADDVTNDDNEDGGIDDEGDEEDDNNKKMDAFLKTIDSMETIKDKLNTSLILKTEIMNKHNNMGEELKMLKKNQELNKTEIKDMIVVRKKLRQEYEAEQKTYLNLRATLYLYKTPIPIGWGDLSIDMNGISMIQHEYFQKVINMGYITILFSEQFMLEYKAVLAYKINLILPQPHTFPMIPQQDPPPYVDKNYKLTKDTILNHLLAKLILNKNDNNEFTLDKSCLLPSVDGKRTRLKDVLQQYFKGGDNLLHKLSSLYGKRVFCLNKNCFRYAESGPNVTSIKQRQECSVCVKARRDNLEIPLRGYDITIKTVNGIHILYIDIEDIVEILPRLFCSNNEITLEGSPRVNTYKEKIGDIDDEDNEDDSEVKEIEIEKHEPINYVNKDGKIKYLTIRRYDENNVLKEKEFYCPLQREDYTQLPSDLYETDHISGNHFDQSPTNLQRLCKICHGLKTVLSGDKGERGIASMFNMLFGRIIVNKQYDNILDERIKIFQKFIGWDINSPEGKKNITDMQKKTINGLKEDPDYKKQWDAKQQILKENRLKKKEEKDKLHAYLNQLKTSLKAQEKFITTLDKNLKASMKQLDALRLKRQNKKLPADLEVKIKAKKLDIKKIKEDMKTTQEEIDELRDKKENEEIRLENEAKAIKDAKKGESTSTGPTKDKKSNKGSKKDNKSNKGSKKDKKRGAKK